MPPLTDTSTVNHPPTVQESYAATVHALRDLGAACAAAVEVRFEPSPGYTGEPAPNGIPNPTLDTVLDPRRLAVADEIARAASDLHGIIKTITNRTAALHAAVARWEGKESSTP